MGHSKATNTQSSLHSVNGFKIEVKKQNGEIKQLDLEPKVLTTEELEEYEISAYAEVSM